MGETQISGFLRDQVELWVDEALVYRDVALLSGDITAKLARPAVAAGLGAMANILYRAPDAARLCRAIQTQLNDTSGCSLIAPDLCALRVLAHDGYALRQIILPILDRLTQNTLPKCWRL
jgi:urease accessory protein